MRKLLLLLFLASPLSAAEIVRYVNTGSAGGDGTTNAVSGANAAYVSLNAALTAEAQDLTDSGGDYIVFKCSGTAADTTTANTGTGYTTNPTCYIKITPNTGQNHGGKWNDNVYRIVTTVDSPLYINEDDVIIDGIQMHYNNNTTSSKNVLPCEGAYTTLNITIQNCIVKSNGADITATTRAGINLRGTSTNPGTYNVINTLVYNTKGDRAAIYCRAGTNVVHNILHSVIYNNTNGIYEFNGVVVATSTVSFTNTDDFFGVNCLNCASDDGDGTGAVQPADWSTVFTDYTNFDFSLKTTDTQLKDAGVNAGVTSDIIGTVRPQNTLYDIGAFEVIVAAPPASPSTSDEFIIQIFGKLDLFPRRVRA